GRQVGFTYEPPASDAVGDYGQIHVTYGHDTLPIHVTIPPDAAKLQLPLFRAHEDWMQVLLFAEGTPQPLHRIEESIDKGAARQRRVIVTRVPQQRVDPDSRRRIRRTAWSFALYEVLPEGGFRKEQLRLRTSKRYEPNGPGELAEGTWQHGAALMVMARGIV